MWKAFWSVVDDLMAFAISGAKEVSVVSVSQSTTLPKTKLVAVDTLLLSSKPVLSTLPAQTTPAIFLPEKSLAATERLLESKTSNLPSQLHQPTVMYVSSVKANCLVDIKPQFDGVITAFPYGTAVTVLQYQDIYAKVFHKNLEGWILKDSLAPEKDLVWPNFIEGQTYDYKNPETIKLRHLIKDEFNCVNLLLSLQSSEYVLCKLISDNRAVLWPLIRPRAAGRWQHILKGVKGVHIGIKPQTDSVMEWLDEKGKAHLAYVETVSPDNSICISAVGLRAVGEFTRETLTESGWKELRPVFIEIQ